ncbi:MAG: hypothetical protein MUF23_10875 [Pirellula sp.]|jgi:hypothetical protein|nr:hypothetical protein [Pirellula sp.]
MSHMKSVVFAIFVALGACEVSQAQVMDPIYGFPFGYTLGAQWSLRNRLPAPPYFSIYPPVYYGKRHLRPYGESPYASFPLLGQIPDYSPVPAEAYAGIPRTIPNPHAPCCAGGESGSVDTSDASPDNSVDAPKVNVVAERKQGSMKIIVNPFAREQVANKD